MHHISFSNLCYYVFVIYIFGINLYTVSSLSHWTPCPKPTKKGNFRDWSLAVPAIFVITHKRWWRTTGSGLPIPSSRAWFFPYSCASSDFPGLLQCPERLDPCVTMYSRSRWTKFTDTLKQRPMMWFKIIQN